MEYTCDECGCIYEEETHYWRRFCSRKCRNRFWNNKRYEAFKEKRLEEKESRDKSVLAFMAERRKER